MGAAVNYLQRSKSGRLSFRRDYPSDLRRYVPGAPREFKRTLGSTRIEDPEAARRFAEAAAEYDATLTVARKLKAQQYDALCDGRAAPQNRRYQTT